MGGLKTRGLRANGTSLCQPRVERREGNERRATLGKEDPNAKTPNGVALTVEEPSS